MVRKTLFAVAVVVALTGCAPASPVDELATTTVDRSSVPGFLALPQQDADTVTACDVSDFGVAPTSTRFQGTWDGSDIYLGVSGTSGVHVISVTSDPEPRCGSGSSIGNSVIGLGDPVSLQYLPQGSAEPPAGWAALSDWMITKDIEG